MKIYLGLLALLAPTAALAQQDVTINSTALVERTVQDAAGKAKTVLEPPKMVTPGDKVIFVLTYRNGGSQPATGFVINNPIPAAVSYEASEGAQPIVSVDGGKNWAPIAALKVRQADGTLRAAAPADVTHLRWTFPAIAPGQAGKLSFRGVVK